MRKQIISAPPSPCASSLGPWLDLDAIARVEVSSEEPAYPIESALLPGGRNGWRANVPGPQIVRIVFDRPQNVKLIRLVFREEDEERTQEFVLRWLSAADQSLREIVRQQYHFSPRGATEEVEEYRVDLQNMAILELAISPHLGDASVTASLMELRVA
jgi:hypothetical protein